MVPCPTGETARGDVTLQHYAEWLDGVVMHGGADVWPGNYGEEPLREEWIGDRVRDIYDLALVKAFAEVGKPIFGVCRGLQLINVAFGGALYQDIETQHPGVMQHRNAVAYDQHFHIQIVPDSRLAQLYPNLPRARVNSIHHQGIKRVAPDFVVEALSEPTACPKPSRQTRTGPRLHRRHPVAPRVSQAGLGHAGRHRNLNDFLAACAHAKDHPVLGWGQASGAAVTGLRGCCGEHCDVTGRRLGSEHRSKTAMALERA